MDQVKKNCKECELAIFCFTPSTDWVFRTKEEVAEKLEKIKKCPFYQRLCKQNLVEPLPSLKSFFK